MVQPIKAAILGAGTIARRMAATMHAVEGVVPYAVAARDLARAQAFAAEHGMQKAFGSYEEMVEDPEIQLVYVATPHSHHYEHAKLCLNAGKHVLVEKAFTLNSAQAREIITLSETRGLFAGEAMWSRFVPGADFLRRLAADGIIGDLLGLRAQLGFPMMQIPRIYDPSLAGGALLDIGVYSLSFVSLVFGDSPETVTGRLVMSDTGVDMLDDLYLRYPGGRTASLFNSAKAAAPAMGMVFGTEGYLVTHELFSYPGFDLFDRDGKLLRHVDTPVRLNGFEYELEAAAAADRSGNTESPQMTHAETLRIMELMDGVRRDSGFLYPAER